MGRRAETKVGLISIVPVPVHARYVVVQYLSAAAPGAVGRPSETLVPLNGTRVGKGLTHNRVGGGAIRKAQSVVLANMADSFTIP